MEIEDLLPTPKFEKIQNLARIELDKYKKEGTNTYMGQYVRWLDEDILPETNKVFDMLPRRESTGTLKKLLHWAITPANSSYPTHIDNKTRLSTVAFYVAPENNVGTIVCENSSTNDNGDHNPPNLPSKNEYELTWKPNKAFVHCSGPKKWHRMRSNNQDRIILSSFLVQPDLIINGRPELDHLLDLDERP
tara:strand:- start:665 stop:1237 length:573 start_codon:yes stop_codon:yes gene_type:complete